MTPPPLPRGLIVSCQARADNPLHGPAFMVAVAQAAWQGGAVAIRAEGLADVAAIHKAVPLPVIGLIKRDGRADGVYITPEVLDVTALAAVGADWVALDATLARAETELRELVAAAHGAGVGVLADLATLEDAVRAAECGVDALATTLHGYTPGTQAEHRGVPNLDLLAQFVQQFPDVPVVAEGRFSTPAHVAAAFDAGAHAVVVGTAITNPREITRTFAGAVPDRP
ncbi:N-acetylmannosamine-6-phosphate 2-epimerase [Deinococcus frigens]|uniref:N-acetylmannosamine-6-phosphate 2-epimerase n=1 Tax=Deinococcus frigens TaxID=249403 RepID=UPI0004973C4A|nr:putative N-acetylmannosamine-6-phosphate 2-epimerase [Deinococcus frigens]